MTKLTSQTHPRKSATFDDYTLSEISRAAATGIYDIRGGGAKRPLPGLDDLLFPWAHPCRVIRSKVIVKTVELMWFWELDLQKIHCD